MLEKEKISKQTLERAIFIFDKLIEGNDPFTLNKLSEEDIVNNEKINLCLKYVNNILKNLDQLNSIKVQKVELMPFQITKEQKEQVEFPPYNIGIVEFTRCVNQVIDTERIKKVTAVDINRGLKQMKILYEIKNPKTGRNKTIINPDVASDYGISVEKYEQNGITIEKIVYDQKGKEFLLQNIEQILENAKKYTN